MATPKSKIPLLQQQWARAGKICLAIGISFLLLSGGMIVWGWSTRAWPTAPGRILSSSWGVENRLSSRGTSSAKVSLIYEYQVGEKMYHGHRIRVGGFGETQRSASILAAKYPKDAAVSVAYHPDNPTKSVLEPVPPSFMGWLGLIGVGTVLLGFHFLRSSRGGNPPHEGENG